MRKQIVGLLLVCLAVGGCGGDDHTKAPNQIAGEPTTLDKFHETTNELTPPSSGQADQLLQRKIIRSGSIELQVRSLDSTEHYLTAIVVRNGGYISNAARRRSAGETMNGEMEIRVPAEKFDALLNETRKAGRVISEQILSNDVTEEFIDLTARAATQRQLEERLLNLLATRKGDLAEIVQIEEKLASVRTEIEKIQGRLQYLENQTGMATLSVRMFEPGSVGTSDTETFGGEISNAFNEGVDSLVSIAGMLVRLLMVLVPLGLLVWGGYRLVKGIIGKRKSPNEPKA